MADLTTFMPVRREPVGHVETFSHEAPGETRDRAIETEDAAGLLVRFEGGARGVVTLSQVWAGRKNHLHWEINGSEASAAWRAERPEELWVGHRDTASELTLRDPGQLAPYAAAHTRMPAGHSEGFGETFRALPGGLHRGRRRGATGRAGLPDVRRRPRAGADRRRDRPLARGGPVGRGDALTRGVIFDCDGTLVDSEPLSGEAWRRIRAPYGYEITDADIEAFVGLPYARTHAYFSERAPLPEPELSGPSSTASCSR